MILQLGSFVRHMTNTSVTHRTAAYPVLRGAMLHKNINTLSITNMHLVGRLSA